MGHAAAVLGVSLAVNCTCMFANMHAATDWFFVAVQQTVLAAQRVELHADRRAKYTDGLVIPIAQHCTITSVSNLVPAFAKAQQSFAPNCRLPLCTLH